MRTPARKPARTFFLYADGERIKIELEEIRPGQVFSIEVSDEEDHLYGTNDLFRCTGPARRVLCQAVLPCEYA
jgi:hypothetical protein